MTDPGLRVLVPLDGSPEAEQILPALMPLFRSEKIRVTLFGVVPKGGSAAVLQTALPRVRRSLRMGGVSSESRVVSGDPADEILWLGKPRRFDFIAMTTHGRAGLRRALAGSVTEKVLRHAEVPVIACRPGTRVGNWSRILVPLDGSPAAETVLPDAERLARATRAGLHLIRVRGAMPVVATMHAVPMGLSQADPRPYLDGVLDRVASEGLLALPDVREGEEAEQIVACAREIGAGLLCLATHGRSGLRRLVLGSVAERVLRSAPCPVLLRRVGIEPTLR